MATAIFNFKMTNSKFIIIAFVILMGCRNQNTPTQNIFQKPSLDDSLSFYFPAILNDTIKRKNPDYENFEQKWYSSSLYSFKVPILYNKDDFQTTYRLLWLRSFHQPVCFTIKEYNDSYYLSAKILDRHPSFYRTIETHFTKIGEVIRDTIGKADRLALISFDTTIALKKSQWNDMESFISHMNFWESPLRDPNEEETTDGSNWILEGRKGNNYHFFVRRNGAGHLMSFGKFLIQISRLKIKEQDIY